VAPDLLDYWMLWFFTRSHVSPDPIEPLWEPLSARTAAPVGFRFAPARAKEPTTYSLTTPSETDAVQAANLAAGRCDEADNSGRGAGQGI
jgi:hypothetical protein